MSSDLPIISYSYNAVIRRWIDGDTVDVEVDLGFYAYQHIRLRLLGINTPELHGEEREAGLAAKMYVEELAPEGSRVIITSKKTGKYGRWLAEVWTQEKDSINNLLLKTGHAVKY